MIIDYDFCNKAYMEDKCVWINENNEMIIISKEKDDVYKTTVGQNNDWTRINYYHKDGTIEETYER